MNIKKQISIIFLLCVSFCLFFSRTINAYELFIYRPHYNKKLFSEENKIYIHGEYFALRLSPSTFPSYNDLRGGEDRWNFGFRNIIFFTENTSFLVQLVTHDQGERRTKFDWHFSLRQVVSEHLVLILGHDSNHDSDYKSVLFPPKRYYVNRNYIGLGIPFEKNSIYIEPFIWFLLGNTRQLLHLDLSGPHNRQEYGLRIGAWFTEKVGLHFQILTQAGKILSLGDTLLADLIIRVKLSNWLELSLGGGIWQDLKTSPGGNKKSFHKLTWGIAIPF